MQALQAQCPWLLPPFASLDDKHIEGCGTECNVYVDVAKHSSKVQSYRQHAAYIQDCNSRALALPGLAPVRLANDIHICFNHHAKAQAR